MGLFKKRVDDPDEIGRLRAEIAAMGQRLEATETAKQQLDQQVVQLTERVGSAAPPEPGTSTPPSTSDLEIIRARIQRLAERIDQEVANRPGDADLAARVEELSVRIDDAVVAQSMRAFERDDQGDDVAARLDELTRRLDAMSAESTPTGEGVDPEDFTSLLERVDQLAGRFDLRTPPPPPPAPLPAPPTDATDETDDATDEQGGEESGEDEERVGLSDLADLHERLDSLVDRVDQVDARMTSISLELANQITELGNEIEQAAAATPGDSGGDAGATEELLAQVADAQERLAAEQARYQIAFRQDLADLADRLRRR